MCQYSCQGEDGRCGTWHALHMVSRAVGGAGLVMVEATAVQPECRITPWGEVVELIDCSTGGNSSAQQLKPFPSY